MESLHKPFRIAVFTPHMDGEYFGKILTTLQKEIQAHASQMTIIQTQVNHPHDTPVDYPLFLDNMDACILIVNAVGQHTLQALARSGKPVVSIAYRQTDIPSHTVLIDNKQGMKDAVLHLIDHGHKEIAFAAAFHQMDQHERFAAYQEALRERDIPFRPELVISVSDNLQNGGREAAEKLLESGVRFTAVATGTDLNAIGLMFALQEKKISIPNDVAIVGFDDIEQAGHEVISLTTVKQCHQILAKAASDIVFQILQGHPPEGPETRVPAALVQRTSCGCRNQHWRKKMNKTAYQGAIVDLQSSLRKMEANNYELIQGLIRATSDERIDLSHLFWNSSHWGYLAVWKADEGGSRQLVIDRSFSKKGDPAPRVGETFEMMSFPSVHCLPESTTLGGPDIVIVHPIINETYEWGFLVLVGPMEKLNNLFINDLSRHSYTILAAALERELLFDRIQSIAERLEIVSKTTNDGIWDWTIASNKVEWSTRIYTMLGNQATYLTDDPSSFFSLVHPDDIAYCKSRLQEHLCEGKPFQIEFRIRHTSNSYIWLFAAGEALRDENGTPVRVIGSFTDITMKKSDEARIINLAYHDTLTGLSNRLMFMERLEQCLQKSGREGTQFALLLLDLDSFKIINDTLGHQAGDKLLQHTANMLRKSVRPHDLIARLGGDEFIIMLTPVPNRSEVEKIAEAIARHIAEPVWIDGQETFNSASIGACLFPEHGDDAESLIKFADMAMYKAKENGRNQMFMYTHDLNFKVEKSFILSKNLRRAIERNEFVLHYQPQLDLRTGSVVGAEALIRWHSAEQGFIQPSEFIPIAEDTGWIVPISVWVLREACMQIKRWQQEGIPSLVMSVNISAQHFRLGNFAKWVKSVLEETFVDPRQLCLEITETTAIQDMEHSVQMLKELVECGVRVAIDDFGTGHSSLMLLRRLPIHYVKIDKSFIRDMVGNQDDAAIVKAVIAMSHSLGLKVIAEGVELLDQLERLKALECDQIQGYYLSRPVPPVSFSSFMNVHSRKVT